jgi:hypothetical protein
MPSLVTVLDSSTGLSSLRFSLDAREMVANDPGRYSITDNSAEVAAQNGPGRKASPDHQAVRGSSLVQT